MGVFSGIQVSAVEGNVINVLGSTSFVHRPRQPYTTSSILMALTSSALACMLQSTHRSPAVPEPAQICDVLGFWLPRKTSTKSNMERKATEYSHVFRAICAFPLPSIFSNGRQACLSKGTFVGSFRASPSHEPYHNRLANCQEPHVCP